jgi:hypothetical protein
MGGRRRRQWLYHETHRLCLEAGDVPLVCPHALRGVMTTIAVACGELPEIVAQALGHTDSRITLAHYIRPGVAQAAALERGLAAFPVSSAPPTLLTPPANQSSLSPKGLPLQTRSRRSNLDDSCDNLFGVLDCAERLARLVE